MTIAATPEQKGPDSSKALIFSLAHYSGTELSLVQNEKVALSVDLFKGNRPRSGVEILVIIASMMESVKNLDPDDPIFISFTLNTIYQLANSVLEQVEPHSMPPSADVVKPEYRMTIEDESVVVSIPQADAVVSVSTPLKTKSGEYKDPKKILSHLQKKLMKKGIANVSMVSLERVKVLLSDKKRYTADHD